MNSIVRSCVMRVVGSEKSGRLWGVWAGLRELGPFWGEDWQGK
jgi:hypothetical protein